MPQFFLGGPGRLSAYGTNELFGNQYYDFRIGYLHDLMTLPPFVGGRVYAIGAYEFGKMYGAPNESGFPNDFAAGVLAETVVGPLFLEAVSATRDTTSGSSSLATCSSNVFAAARFRAPSILWHGRCRSESRRYRSPLYSIQPPVTLMTWPVM